MLHYPRIGPHKPKPWVGGPGAPLNVAGPFLVTLGTFGIAPNYLSVPSPHGTNAHNDGLSFPRLGPFLLD
jgi:hypothetical protein